MSNTFRHRFLRASKSIVLGAVGLVMSIIISFILVRHLTQGMSRTPASNPELIRQATLLRQFSNGLLTLAEEYVQQIPLEAEFPKPGQIQRTSKTFLSKLNELRQHVDDDTLVYLPAYRNLMAALDRIAAMASHPEDKTLRKHALNDILAATEATENYLDSQGVSSLLPDAPKKLSFKNLLQTAPDK